MPKSLPLHDYAPHAIFASTSPSLAFVVVGCPWCSEDLKSEFAVPFPLSRIAAVCSQLRSAVSRSSSYFWPHFVVAARPTQTIATYLHGCPIRENKNRGSSSPFAPLVFGTVRLAQRPLAFPAFQLAVDVIFSSTGS